jgi:hypothetical protein
MTLSLFEFANHRVRYQGFSQRGITSNDSMGGYPPHLEFFWNFFSGFENLITLVSVILRHLEAELIILRRDFFIPCLAY